jgi:hypothetical protein
LFPDLEYTFKHALTHDVAYGSLLEDRRRALHAAVVEAIERLHADRLNEEMEVLAHHAARARLGAKAVRYLRKAGEKAVARSANEEAAALFQTALGLLAEMPESVETLSEMLDVRIALGPALIAAHGTEAGEVRACYDRALELVDRLEDFPRRFPVLWGLWFVAYTRGRYREAHDSALRLLSDAQAGDDRVVCSRHIIRCGRHSRRWGSQPPPHPMPSRAFSFMTASGMHPTPICMAVTTLAPAAVITWRLIGGCLAIPTRRSHLFAMRRGLRNSSGTP